MTPFTIGEIHRIRVAVQFGGRVANIAAAFSGVHTRDEINEAWWAIKRYALDSDARDHANFVLQHQAAKIPLVNGRPFNPPPPRPRAMF